MNKKWFRFLKILLLIIIVPIFIFSCMMYVRTSPGEKNFRQRLESFPTGPLPLRAPANIYWDDHMIPFIEAETDEDAVFLLGMVHAHLRFAQMSLFRRVVQGRLSESAGPLAASVDHALRILDFGKAAESIEKNLPAATRQWLQNYVRGINFYQNQMAELPTDFKLLDLEKEPWTVRDIITLGRLVGADVSWFTYFSFLKLRNRSYWPGLWDRLIELGFQSSTSFTTGHSEMSALFNGAAKSGSNAFVIGPERTSDGEAMIASDPHLGIQLPNTWLIAGIKSPTYHVVGFMFPGIPMVLIGRNPAVAWGGTNMRSASSDVYRIDETDTARFSEREEVIHIRWWPDRTITIRGSELGPILSDMPLIDGVEEGETLALKWVGHQVSDEFSTFLKVNRSTDWPSFKDAFNSYAVSGQNFLYADTAGNIGQVLAVRAPIRPYNRPSGLVISRENQWQGYRNPNELPAALNPESGFIVSANNRPAITEPPVGFFFSSNDRVDRISRMISEKPMISFQDIREIQQDVVVPSAIVLKELLLSKIEGFGLDTGADADLRQFLTTLKMWDGAYTKESQGPLAFQLFLFHFIGDYYSVRYDDDIVRYLSSADNANHLITENIRSDTSGMVERCFRTALPDAVYAMKRYENWGDMHRLQLKHILGNIPVLGRRFQFCDLPADGSVNSVMKTAHAVTDEKHGTFYGANARYVSRMKDMDENYFVLLGGQDGWLGSDYFLDHVPLWNSGAYIRIPLRLNEIRKSFSTHLRLVPER